MKFHRLNRIQNSLYITDQKSFNPIATFKKTTVIDTFNFAYDMSFGSKGEHRAFRSGGTHNRKNGEIFVDTFQGKLSEFAVYNKLYNLYDIKKPDLDTYGLGTWDDSDLIVNDKKISVKSTKFIGNLLLLEEKDWDKNGEYIPNIGTENSIYDFFVMVRINPICERILKKLHGLYSNTIDKKILYDSIIKNNWSYDIPGFITLEDLKYIIKNSYIIYQNELLKGKTRMDANNYYVQSGDMRDINELNDYI